MTNTISKESIIPDIWENFYNRIKDQVTIVFLNFGKDITIQNYVSSFPDQLIDTKSEYPIVVVNDPKVPTEPLTVGKTRIDGTIEVEVYTNQAESASKFLSLIINAIETYKGDLSSVLIKNVEVIDTNQDSATRGKIKLHKRSVTFSFTHTYAKTKGF